MKATLVTLSILLGPALGFLTPAALTRQSPRASGSTRFSSPALEAPLSEGLLVSDDNGRERLPFKKEGYAYWTWESESGPHQVHYVKVGDDDKPPIVLIHGFGASVFHWRYNIPELSKHFRVYALDLVGFGLSDKPLIDYSAETWRDQVAKFLEEVVQVKAEEAKTRAVVVGNSLGGYTALSVAAHYPSLTAGCAVLNGAGTFDENVPPPKPAKDENDMIEQVKEGLQSAFRKAVLYGAFYLTKRPSRIKQVLQQVYTSPVNVDDELVESIRFPADHPNAPEVFCRVVSRTSRAGSLSTINQLLGIMEVPLLLLWGDKDPWIGPRMADRMQSLYPSATKVTLAAGHCPHDEVPEDVNRELLAWIGANA